MGWVPALWKTYRYQKSDYRSVALSLHIMKTLWWLIPHLLSLEVKTNLIPHSLHTNNTTALHASLSSLCKRYVLWFFMCFQLHPTKYTERQSLRSRCGVLLCFLDHKLHDTVCQVGNSWNINEKHGAPQGTVLAPHIFTLHTADLTIPATSINTHITLPQWCVRITLYWTPLRRWRWISKD